MAKRNLRSAESRCRPGVKAARTLCHKTVRRRGAGCAITFGCWRGRSRHQQCARFAGHFLSVRRGSLLSPAPSHRTRRRPSFLPSPSASAPHHSGITDERRGKAVAFELPLSPMRRVLPSRSHRGCRNTEPFRGQLSRLPGCLSTRDGPFILKYFLDDAGPASDRGPGAC